MQAPAPPPTRLPLYLHHGGSAAMCTGAMMDIDELRKVCSAWPGVSQSVKWEDDLVFSVGAKMFAVTALRGPHKGRMSFKVDRDRFLELTDQPGLVPAPYMA